MTVPTSQQRPVPENEPLVAKRRVRETWREAVARRGAVLGIEADALAAFDAYRSAEMSAHEAAYRALHEHDALERVDGPRNPARLAEEAVREDAPGIGS